MTLAEQIDRTARDRVLVFGSPPPAGRDLDLLARPPDHAVLAAWLRDNGFLDHAGEWVRFRDCSAESLDLVPTSAWGLPPDEEEALFAEARPIDGFDRLVRTAPHHLLLMLAQRLVEGDGTLSDKRRARLDGALREDPDAWRTARERAAAWRAQRALDGLESVYASRRTLPKHERAASLGE